MKLGTASLNEGFTILRGGNEPERKEWLELWHLWPKREVFAHPGWVDLFLGERDYSLCAAWRGAKGGVLFPLIARSIAKEPWGNGFDGIDLSGPYGYGGPYCWGEVDPAAFWLGFEHWVKAARAVSCFARLSLFNDHLAGPVGSEICGGVNIVRQLGFPPETLWMDYAHKVRKNVHRALREKVRVEIDLSGTRLGEFHSIYCSTMDRRRASPSYYFNRQFFTSLIQGLRGNFAFFHAIHRETIISSELVLSSANHLYSFLGGTLAAHFDLRPNDLLKHAIILWGSRQGKETYVLGGGYGEADGILKYKRSFAPNGEVEFKTFQMIIDRESYDRLLAARERFELERGVAWRRRQNYFPEYRA